MIQKTHQELHRYLEERAGDAYRSAFHYKQDDWEAIYVREDLVTQQVKQDVPDLIERARTAQILLRDEEYPPLGKLTATTEVHENGVILHFVEADGEGTVVSLDVEAASRLSGFLSECQNILTSHEATKYRTPEMKQP